MLESQFVPISYILAAVRSPRNPQNISRVSHNWSEDCSNSPWEENVCDPVPAKARAATAILVMKIAL